MRKKACLICGSIQSKVIFETSDKRFGASGKKDSKYHLLKCLNCGFVYLDFTAATPKEFMKIYPAVYWHTSRSFLQKILLNVLIWSKYKRTVSLKNKGKVLDVGCGTGEFLKFFKRGAWEVYGQDISIEACREARKKIKNVFCGELEKANYKKDYFDLVFLNSVLHQMADPLGELLLIRKLIKKDGLLLISVPDISSWQFIVSGENWFHLDSPRHLYYFQPRSIASFLNRAGFKIKKISYPLGECPLDLFHSIKYYLPEILHPIILPLPLLLKTIPKFRGIMEIIALPD